MNSKTTRTFIKNPAGFTIIEVLIAIAIFSIGFMSVGALQTGSLNRVTSSRNKTTAMEALEAQAEVLKQTPLYAQDYNDTDDGVDQDGDGSTMFDFATAFQEQATEPDFSVPRNGYMVHWWLGAPSDKDFEGNDVEDRWDVTAASGATVRVSVPVTMTVTRPGDHPENDALMSLEFVKCWVTDG